MMMRAALRSHTLRQTHHLVISGAGWASKVRAAQPRQGERSGTFTHQGSRGAGVWEEGGWSNKNQVSSFCDLLTPPPSLPSSLPSFHPLAPSHTLDKTMGDNLRPYDIARSRIPILPGDTLLIVPASIREDMRCRICCDIVKEAKVGRKGGREGGEKRAAFVTTTCAFHSCV